MLDFFMKLRNISNLFKFLLRIKIVIKKYNQKFYDLIFYYDTFVTRKLNKVVKFLSTLIQ